MTRLIRPKELSEMLGIGISTIYDKINNDPEFPPRVKLGKGNAVAFKLRDVEEWIEKNTEEKEAISQ